MGYHNLKSKQDAKDLTPTNKEKIQGVFDKRTALTPTERVNKQIYDACWPPPPFRESNWTSKALGLLRTSGWSEDAIDALCATAELGKPETKQDFIEWSNQEQEIPSNNDGKYYIPPFPVEFWNLLTEDNRSLG